jgi:hypothetical protein
MHVYFPFADNYETQFDCCKTETQHAKYLADVLLYNTIFVIVFYLYRLSLTFSFDTY